MKILIVEDHSLMLDALGGLVRQLDPNVTVLEASNAADALAIAGRTEGIDLLILDLLLSSEDENNQFKNLKAFRTSHAEIPVVVYSGVVTKEAAHGAIELGAMGFIPKSTAHDKPKIVAALRAVLDGMIYMPPELFQGANTYAPPPMRESRDPLDAFRMTERDRQLLSLAVQGKPDKVIARLCGIGVQNVKNRLKDLRERFEVANRTELLYKLCQLQVRLELIYVKNED